MGSSVEEILSNLLRVNDDDVLSQQSSIYDITWMYTSLGVGTYIMNGTNHILHPILYTFSRDGEHQSR